MKAIRNVFLFCAAFSALNLPVPALAQGAGGPTPVIVSPVVMETITDEVQALGTLLANESIEVSSSVTEFVTGLHFEDGQSVAAGDILVEMDAAEEQAELTEQQSVMAEAKRQVERLRPLVKQGAAAESALDEREREMQGAEARIAAIQSRINQRVIKAPFDGEVGLRNISIGALAQPGMLITTLDDVSVMKLDFAVPEVFLAAVTPGVKIEAESAAWPDKIFTGEIASIGSRVDPITRAIEARAMIANPEGRLKPGMLMRVQLRKSPRPALVVPEEALITRGEKQFVLVIEESDDGTISARRQEVTLGARQFGKAEILSGLEDGQRVVTHGTLRVRPGAPLEITATETQDRSLYEMLNGDGEINSQTSGDSE